MYICRPNSPYRQGNSPSFLHQTSNEVLYRTGVYVVQHRLLAQAHFFFWFRPTCQQHSECNLRPGGGQAIDNGVQRDERWNLRAYRRTHR